MVAVVWALLSMPLELGGDRVGGQGKREEESLGATRSLQEGRPVTERRPGRVAVVD
jgi:hypothetical protein